MSDEASISETQVDFDVFISYRTSELPDKPVAEELQRVLETFPVPRELATNTVAPRRWRSRLKVFRDITDLAATWDLTAAIKKTLRSSRYMVVVCTPNILHSSYCAQEIRYFSEYHGTERLLLLLVEGEPEDYFPLLLESRPLAADVRADTTKAILNRLKGGALGKSKQPKFKLLAPILGCDPDELVKRDRQRFRRQLCLRSAFILTLLLAFCAIYVLITKQRVNAVFASSSKDLTNGQFEEIYVGPLKRRLGVVSEFESRIGLAESQQRPPIDAGRQNADAAIALLHLKAPDVAIQYLSWPENIETLTQFAARCNTRGGLEQQQLIDLLELVYDPLRNGNGDETNGDLRRVCYGLLIALGEYTDKNGRVTLPHTFVDNTLRKWYLCDPSAGIHSACGWLLRQAGRERLVEELDRQLAHDPSEIPDFQTVNKDWLIAQLVTEVDGKPERFLLTFILIQAGKTTVAVCDRETTNRLWERFSGSSISDYPDRPKERVDFKDVKAFCGRLSELFPDTLDLRLPTQNEWEIAWGRAETSTPFFFGSDENMLRRYAASELGCAKEGSSRSRTCPVATRRPNALGFFDIIGNVTERSHDEELLGGSVGMTPDIYMWEERVNRQNSPITGFRICLSHRSTDGLVETAK